MRYQICLEVAPVEVASAVPAAPRGIEAEETKRRHLVRAWVPALPGCFCEAPSDEAALARMPAVIAEYLAWLRRHGEEAPSDAAIQVEVVERIETAPGRSEPCFAADCVAAAADDVERALRLMSHAREDLLALIGDLPDAVRDWKPAPDRWTIREIVAHVASAEGYYRTSLLDAQPVREPPEERFDLALQRGRAVGHLRSLTPEQRARVFRPNWPWREDEGEEWPVRKALRRFIYHERFHTRDIQQTLAWLLMSAPEEAP
jgi:hypothetical protein